MAITNLLNQTIQIEPRLADTDLHGRPSFGAPQSTKGRFQQTNRTITTAEREREPIDGLIWTMPSNPIEVGDRVTYNSIVYRAMRSSPIVLGNGKIHHYEAMVQLWSYGA